MRPVVATTNGGSDALCLVSRGSEGFTAASSKWTRPPKQLVHGESKRGDNILFVTGCPIVNAFI